MLNEYICLITFQFCLMKHINNNLKVKRQGKTQRRINPKKKRKMSKKISTTTLTSSLARRKEETH